MRLAALLIATLPGALCGAGLDDPAAPQSREATSHEVSELQDYTRSLSKEWLKSLLKIDLDLISAQLRRRAKPYSEISTEIQDSSDPKAAALPGREPVLYAMHLRLEQYDDVLRLTRDPQDIPFALRFEGKGRLFNSPIQLETIFFLPLSWKDELRAEAVVPLPRLDLPVVHSMLREMGFGYGWAIKSVYTNRLGLSNLRAGLGTKWKKDWDLDYDWRIRFGQNQAETSHWIKLGRGF